MITEKRIIIHQSSVHSQGPVKSDLLCVWPGYERALDVAGLQDQVGVHVQLEPGPVPVVGVGGGEEEGGDHPVPSPALDSSRLQEAVLQSGHLCARKI